MAYGRTVITITHPNDDLTLPSGTEAGRVTNAAVVFLEKNYAGGTRTGTTVAIGQGGTQATGTLTFSSATGTVGATINGIAATVTAAGGDNNTATLVANTINGSVNPLIQGIVTASATGNVVTITAVAYGASGNAVTLAASGTGVTASGARLTGGVSPTTRTLVR